MIVIKVKTLPGRMITYKNVEQFSEVTKGPESGNKYPDCQKMENSTVVQNIIYS